MKKYITPEMTEYELLLKQAILAGSGEDEPGYGGEGDPDENEPD
jgi:hypothetical protein